MPKGCQNDDVTKCQKDVKNCGETNIWSDTNYLPGTRLLA